MVRRNTVDEFTFEIARECTQKIIDDLHLDRLAGHRGRHADPGDGRLDEAGRRPGLARAGNVDHDHTAARYVDPHLLRQGIVNRLGI